MRPQQGTLFLEKVIQEVDHQALRELNIPPEIKTDFKVVEHALCQLNKYCRFANQGVPPLTFKSPAVFLIKIENTRFVCSHQKRIIKHFFMFCNHPAHLACLNKNIKYQQPDHLKFSCQDCNLLTKEHFHHKVIIRLHNTCTMCFQSFY